VSDGRRLPILRTRGLTVEARHEGKVILRNIDLNIPRGVITGVIGPSGAGKSTLLKCLNRLIDLTPTLEVSGTVLFGETNIRALDPDELRRQVGIVFQNPVTFPGSIRRNVLFAASRLGLVEKRREEEIVERCLTAAGLWLEVRDRLARPAAALSAGQQQRLAIARALAGQPEVLLMDEPTSALDPKSTGAIEETIVKLKDFTTIVLVTHHLEQARRLADWIACICPREGAGELIESNHCELLFESPQEQETMAYVGGRRC